MYSDQFTPLFLTDEPSIQSPIASAFGNWILGLFEADRTEPQY